MRVLLKHYFLFPALCIHLLGCGGNSDAKITSTSSQVSVTASAVATSVNANNSSAAVLVENSTQDCVIAALKPFADLPEIGKLPNPFIFMDGTPVLTKKQWPCRRAEIAAQAQAYELGEKPPAPQQVAGSVSSGKISVIVRDKDKQIAFDALITLPSTGVAPYPAIIGIGNSYLNNDELSRQGIAVIQFPNNLLGEQHNGQSRGKGLFYEIYGSDHRASAMMAWAWGVSRLLDVLHNTSNTIIDPQRVGVTGCSRNGKGALIAGAFDERLALTIMQESGSGGAASWRISDAQLASGQNVQTLRQIVTENVWFTEQFKIFSEAANKLPFDHHSVMGLIAPRGLLVVENTGMEWLGNQSTYTTAVVAREIWKALGAADNMGVTQVDGHNHCQLPASQQPAVNAFVEKFLLHNNRVSTHVQKTDGTFPVEISRWVNWVTPILQ
ncbi:glucuronyl esterase domain-containing protein [Cellvibrio sp. OA-2007]|uniref:glucuronyl esterase domain-containing protein n=1 Tax=Cellvibrio sp. OA-2007 TaxID=529823 RepID=UPI000784D822|nr:hypothetical protein [Cellvibrio sp. OA-2007]